MCNNVLFENMLGTDFVNFLNNRPTSTPVAVSPKQKNRVCHLLHVVSERLVKPSLAKPWIYTPFAHFGKHSLTIAEEPRC